MILSVLTLQSFSTVPSRTNYLIQNSFSKLNISVVKAQTFIPKNMTIFTDFKDHKLFAIIAISSLELTGDLVSVNSRSLK